MRFCLGGLLSLGLLLWPFEKIWSESIASSGLSWSECVEQALQNNPQYNSSRHAYEASVADVRQSYNGFFPSMNLLSGYSKNNTSSDGVWSASGNASLNVLNLQSAADIRTAQATRNESQAGWRSTSATVLFNLRQAFSNLLLSQEQINVSEKILELRQKNSDLVALKYDSGRESKGNMLRSKAELAEAKADLAKSRRGLIVDQNELNRWLGHDPFSSVQVEGDLGVVALPKTPDFSQTMLQHPDVKKAEAAVAVSRARVSRARSSLWPSLTANYTRSFEGDSYFPDNPSWTASGVLRYPLFGSGLTSTYYQVSSTKRELEKSEEDLKTTEYKVRVDMESAWAALANATEQIDVEDQFLQAARQRNDEALVRYSSGLMTYENWETVVTELVNFEQSAIRAKRDAMVAEANWGLALGRTLEDQ